MNELTKKELRECGVPAAVVLCVLTAIWLADVSVTAALIAPNPEPTYAVIVTGAVLGFALGVAQFAGERSRGTLPFLMHREGGRWAMFRAKSAVGIGVALVLAMLPPIVFGLVRVFGEFAPVVQPMRMVEHAFAGLVVVPAYACGVLVALIASNLLLVCFLGLIACFGCFSYSCWLPLPVFQMSILAIPMYALGQLILASVVGTLAWRIFGRGHDRDAALPLRLQAHSVLFALLLFVIPAWGMISTPAVIGQSMLFQHYPLIVRYTDGRYATMERSEWDILRQGDGKNATTFTLPNGTIGTEPDPAQVYSPSQPMEIPEGLGQRLMRREGGTFSSYSRWSQIPIARGPAPTELRDKNGRRVLPMFTRPEDAEWNSDAADETYLDLEEGVVRQFLGVSARQIAARFGRGLKPYPREFVIRRPDGKAFSRETIVTAYGFEPALLIDRGDQTIWILDLAEEGTRLAQLALPDGDLLKDTRMEQLWAPEGWSTSLFDDLVFIGDKAEYQWTMSGFQPTSTCPSQQWWLRHCRSEYGESTLSEMTVRLRKVDEKGRVGPGSEVAYVQRYEPRTPGECASATLIRVGLQCGPPVLSLQRLLFGSGGPLMSGIVPGLSRIPKDTTRFHLLHVLLGLTLGAFTWRRVARRGGTRGERLLWGVFVALFGVFAYIFLLLLAPRPRVLLRAGKNESPSRKPAPSLATA